MGKGVIVKPDIIRWAIRSSGKDLETLFEKFTKLKDWITEENELTVNEINKLSKELRIPFGYFFLPEPPVEEIKLLKYRTIENNENSNPSRELIDTIKYMEKKQEFMREALIEDGFSPLNFVASASLEENPIELAQKIKAELELLNDWNKNKTNAFNILRTAVSNLGIMVMQNGVVGNNNYRTLDVTEFRAFVLIDNYVPLVFLNAKDSLTAKTFSLCHELVHIWLGIDELYNDNFKLKQDFNNLRLERFCNEVAAELLLPRRNLEGAFNNNDDLYTNIKYIAKTYSLSDLVVCIRLKETRIIDDSTFNKIYSLLLEEMNDTMANITSRPSQGGNHYNTLKSRLDPNFVSSVNRKAKEGRLLYTEAYDLVGAKGKTYDKLIQAMEGN